MNNYSVITVVYNGERYIKNCLDSILQQINVIKEYIIIDGKSTDRTIEIINNYISLFGNKLIIISEKDSGIYNAMNKGIRIASGEIIVLLNSDDILKNNIIVNIDGLFNDEVDYVYGSVEIIDKDGGIIGISKPIANVKESHKKYLGMPFNHLSLVVRKRVYDQLGYFNETLKYSADYDFILRLIESPFVGKECNLMIGEYRNTGVSGGYVSIMESAMILKKRSFSLYLRYLLFTCLKKIFIFFTPKKVLQFFLRILKSRHQYISIK